MAWPMLSTEADAGRVAEGFEAEDARLRAAALQCATALWTDRKPLVEALHIESDRRIRVRLLEALLETSDENRQALLDWGLASDDALLQAAALRALGPGDTVAGGRLQEFLASAYPTVREAAVEAAIQRTDAAALEHSLSLLNAPSDASVRQIVCHAARHLESDVAVPPLKTLLADELDHLVRSEACDSLLDIHSPDALDALNAYVNHADQRLRVAVINRMGQWGDKEVATRLFPILSDQDHVVLYATIQALLILKNERLSEFADRLDELAHNRETLNMPAEAIRALGWIGYRDIIPYLSSILQKIAWDDPYKKRQAALEVLLLFEHGDSLDRVFTIATQRVVPPPPGVPAGPMYDHDSVRVETVRYIAQFADREQALSLYEMYEDIPPKETRIMLMRMMRHFTEVDYEFDPRHRYPYYRVENIGDNPFPSVQPPGIRPRS
jgi:hypothetical protein